MEPILLTVGALLGLVIGAMVGWVPAGWPGEQGISRPAHRNRPFEWPVGAGSHNSTASGVSQGSVSETAKLTAAEALQSNNDQFLKLANENLSKTLESASRDLQQRHQQFQELVKPLSENYSKLNPQIETLAKQSQTLAAETGKLSSALTDNPAGRPMGRGAVAPCDRPGRQ